MEKIVNKLEIQNIEPNMDLSNFTFHTKDEFSEILFNEKTYEIAHILKYNYEQWIDNSNYISELKKENLDFSFLKNTLIFMISRGIPQSVLLQKEFNIDTSDISIDVFLEWFVNRMNWLEESEFLIDFVKLYNNQQELWEKIWEKVDILLLSELIYNWLEFEKYDDNKMDNILLYFEKKLKKEKLLDRVNKIWFYDWEIICWELFEDYEKSYSKIQNIFDFTEEEKDEFKILKQDNFYLSYETEIKKTIESFEEINFSKIGKFTFNDFSWEEIKSNFYKKITEILISLNYKNNYSIKFIDISWKQLQFNIWNGLQLGGYNYNLLEKDIFLEHITEQYWEFILNLDKNNMDFSILIFKKNWDKDDFPEESEDDFLMVA